MKPTIWKYFINWNDSRFIPDQRNIGPYCERIVMYDNYSSDNSESVALAHGMEVRKFGNPGVLDDFEYLKVKNEVWKEARGQGVDYVIVCDADEYVVGVPTSPIPHVQGFNIMSGSFAEENLWGYEDANYSKRAIFSPDIKEINYTPGCHVCNPEPDLRSNTPEMILYHMRETMGIEAIIERYREYRQRMSQRNRQQRMGFHYLHDEGTLRAEYERKTQQARYLGFIG